MLVSCRTPQRRRRSLRAATAIGVALLMASVACSADPPPEQSSTRPTTGSTPLADYDTSDVTLVRGEFCAGIAAETITEVLGAEATETQSWQPGRRLPGSKDISNEFGCSWGTDSVTARAWIFAPPISRERATDFVAESVGMKCRRLTDAAAVGDPGVAQRCGLNTGATLTGISGLVDDAWVGCEVVRTPLSSTSGSGSAETEHVGEWCVAVLEALRSD